MSLDIELEVPLEALESLEVLTQRAINSALYRATKRIRNEARSVIPRRTGKLQDSLKVGFGNDEITLILDAKNTEGQSYAKAVDEGAKPHTIAAKNADYLHFKTRSGDWVRTKSVSHPGYAGRSFMDQVKEIAIRIIKEEIAQALLALEFSRRGTSTGGYVP